MTRQLSNRRVGLVQVAKSVGVSVATVSNAYNRPSQLSGELRQRIFDAAARLGYRGPDPLARSLRSGHTGAVGLILTMSLAAAVDDPSTLLFLQGLTEQLEGARAALLVVPSSGGADPDASLVQAALVDGFIAYSLADDDPLLASALARGVRVVVVDQPALDIPSVRVANEEGANAVTAHLLSLGHRRFGILTLRTGRAAEPGEVTPEREVSITYDLTRTRLRGFITPLRDAGIPRSDIAIYDEEINSRETGYAGASWLLARKPRPTALVIMADVLALGALSAARDAGLRVPEDVSITGFDDIPHAALAEPPLTTVRQPLKEKGELAMRLLLTADDTALTPMPTSLVVRGSTGRAPLLLSES